MTEAEEEIASALSLPEYPTAAKQKRMIEERAAALYAGEISIPPEVVDEILRTGGNKDRSQLRIIYQFMTDGPAEEDTEFVRREYGKGGKGFTINDTDYAVWFDELGMQIAEGHSAQEQAIDKVFLPWEDISGRIRQLLRQGEYAPQAVLDAARENALMEHAQVLSYLVNDMEDGVAELVFADTGLFSGGYPEKTERIAEYLAYPENFDDLLERLEGFAEAYEEDFSLMRFQNYAPKRVLEQFRRLAKEAVPFQAREGFMWQEHPIFITQDEVDDFLAGGGSYADGRLTTFGFYLSLVDN